MTHSGDIDVALKGYMQDRLVQTGVREAGMAGMASF